MRTDVPIHLSADTIDSVSAAPVNFTLILLAFQMENEYSLTKTVFQFAIEIDRYLFAWHVLLKRLDNSRSSVLYEKNSTRLRLVDSLLVIMYPKTRR